MMASSTNSLLTMLESLLHKLGCIQLACESYVSFYARVYRDYVERFFHTYHI